MIVAWPWVTHVDITAADFAKGQDPRILVAACFRYPERVQIESIRIVEATHEHVSSEI